MSTVVTMLFGSPGAALGWVSEERIPHIPMIGATVRITIHAFGDDTSVEGQVYRAWDGDDGEHGGLLIYGGTRIPDVEFRNLIEIAGWEPLSDDTLDLLAGTIHESPAMAASHEVNLFVGEGPDMRLYRRVIQPSSPILPLFGQRMRMTFLELPYDDDDMWGFTDDDVDDVPVSDEEWQEMQRADRAEVDTAIDTRQFGDVAEIGIPVVVFYSALIDPGTARLGFWTSHLGDGVTDIDLVADDWEVVSIPDRFDPFDFGVERRLDLARRTHVLFESNNYDSVRVAEWWLENPEDVGEADSSFLPPFLYQWATGVQQLDQIDAYLERWANGTDG